MHIRRASGEMDLARRFNAGNKVINITGVASATGEWNRSHSIVADATPHLYGIVIPGVKTPG